MAKGGLPTLASFSCAWHVIAADELPVLPGATPLVRQTCRVEVRRTRLPRYHSPFLFSAKSSSLVFPSLGRKPCPLAPSFSYPCVRFLQLEISEVEFSGRESQSTPYQTVTVTDAATGEVAFTCVELGCAQRVPVRATSSSADGFILRYDWVTSGSDVGLQYGMRAVWRYVCFVDGRLERSADQRVVLDGVAIRGNSAARNGGCRVPQPKPTHTPWMPSPATIIVALRGGNLIDCGAAARKPLLSHMLLQQRLISFHPSCSVVEAARSVFPQGVGSPWSAQAPSAGRRWSSPTPHWRATRWPPAGAVGSQWLRTWT